MMKKLGITVIGLLLMASSPQAAAWNFGFNKDKVEAAVESESQKPETELKAHIEAIYADARRNYPPDPGSPPKNEVNLDERYCSQDWNRMVESVLEKDRKDKVEFGFFDADYWVMGQDWGDLTPQNIQVTVQDDSHATVTFEMDGTGSDMKQVQLDMVYEQGSWRIDNFIDRKHSLDWKQSMREYLGQ